MDIFSLLVFLIYILLILIILIYISPILSAVVMIIVPVAALFFLPDFSLQFLSLEQFTFMEVPIYNIHVLLIVWSALIGVVVYSEVLSWYLLRDERPKVKEQETKEAQIEPSEPPEPPKPMKNKLENFLLGLGRIMSGKK